ncbi:MAG: hypothetical protein H6735_19320 [Alphaproteobacteria bacterium]|nr:hypothetical protein [Alphaproteobacteria bacterium]
MRVVHRNIALYEATGRLCREVDATATLVERIGRGALAQWTRHSVLTLALIVSGPDPDEDRALQECARVREDLRVCAAVAGASAPLLRALGHLDRVAELLETWAGPEGSPIVVSVPVTTAEVAVRRPVGAEGSG